MLKANISAGRVDPMRRKGGVKKWKEKVPQESHEVHYFSYIVFRAASIVEHMETRNAQNTQDI